MEVCKFNETYNNNNNHDEIDELKLYKHLGGGLPTVNSLTDLIQELNAVFASDSVNVELVHYLMKSYKSNPLDWKKYAKFDRYRYVNYTYEDILSMR